MSTLLGTLEFLSLSLWLGSDVFLSFVVAPGAFRILGSRDQAGAIVGFALWRMHFIGVVCGIVILLARLLRMKTFAGLVTPAALCVVVMLESGVLLAGFAAMYLMVRELALTR